ncbi:head completion/stabilization protein [Aeromonas salmonicida]|uniref:head completion/stabilization protein n=1 Tax=Aeromonas salmonicida TaxID=645 RepID=UPI003D07E076
MSTGFIATAPTAPAEGEIASSPFWPAISLPDLRETVRLDGTVTTARLKHAVIDAITSVNRDLADWRRALTIPSYERGVARLLRYDRHP